MLVIILLLFLVTEIPQGVMALLSGIWGNRFFTHCYSGMGEILDLVALINSAVNFVLYVLTTPSSIAISIAISISIVTSFDRLSYS